MSTVLVFLRGIGGKILGVATLILGIFTLGAWSSRNRQQKKNVKRDVKDLQKQYQADGAIREKNDKEVFESMRDKFYDR